MSKKSGPIYIVSYCINGSRLLGHTVRNFLLGFFCGDTLTAKNCAYCRDGAERVGAPQPEEEYSHEGGQGGQHQGEACQLQGKH